MLSARVEEESAASAFMAFLQTGFAVDVDQNDVRADLFDAAPGDNIFMLRAPEPEQLTGAGNNQLFQTAGGQVKFNVPDKAESCAVTAVDNFLLA